MKAASMRRVSLSLSLSLILMMGVGVAVEGQQLKLLVPINADFNSFTVATCEPLDNKNCTFSGLSVEVFKKAVQRLSSFKPFPSYEFIPFQLESNYDGMLEMLVNKEADGVVADLTITAERMKIVDFSHPYIQSTLEMVVPFTRKPNKVWSFLQPFSTELWACIFVVFISTGILIFVLEHNNAHFHQQGMDLKTRFGNIFWFTTMTLFFAQRSEVMTRLGRVSLSIWLVVVLIITSSYTASLASILAVQHLTPSVQSFNDLVRSNLPIGYQQGSFTREMLSAYLRTNPSRLVALSEEREYKKILKSGLVAAILDESPYLQEFLYSNCGSFAKVGTSIAYLGGFGFAFQKNSSLAHDISIGILELEQDGDLQGLRDGWINGGNCDDTKNQVSLGNFVGIFILVAIIYSACFSLKILGWALKKYNCKQHQAKVLNIDDKALSMHP